ncbi:hypothetical protein ACFPFP_32165 [Bradyrhizobium sp. GCM10023182]|uniref:Class I SAM-dependent methyltransferase n=1 Tax=Bradyrhizobium zhengyangense TaxID=2911009 RepID=A0ABS9LX41_9BRAD|nr:hypothetical protein [Bradyrhizobium zhengyangense]MCG2671595.1 hypothetical protein [Bradyrhizobium zhengyangense]
MKDAPPPLANRIARKVRSLFMRSELQAYLSSISADNPLRGLPAKIVGDASADPTELFNHYDAFGFWVAARLARETRPRRILDIGSPKAQNAILSAYHDVTAVVLADCHDRFSAIRYVQHDVTLPLPFPAGAFDCFTSTVALPLIGLGRYGDRLDGNSLPNLVSELGRVMSDDAILLISMTVGPNLLAFNNGWYLDLATIRSLFAGWRLVEVVVDNWSSPKGLDRGDVSQRFANVEQLPVIARGDYRVAFCALVRQTEPADGS